MLNRTFAVALAWLAVAGSSPALASGEPAGVEPPSREHGGTIARIIAPTWARPRPGSARDAQRVGTQTSWSGAPQVLLALGSATQAGREWLKVLLPTRPNGRAGWILRDKTVLSRTRYWIHVATATRSVTVYRDGRRLRAFRAVVGAPRTPTPHTLAAIYERNRQPDPRAFLGPWALSLTALSNVLESYGGGPGRVAIHGRAGASLRDPLGSARSHGCIRISNRAVEWLARNVPVGTPVQMSNR